MYELSRKRMNNLRCYKVFGCIYLHGRETYRDIAADREIVLCLEAGRARILQYLDTKANMTDRVKPSPRPIALYDSFEVFHRCIGENQAAKGDLLIKALPFQTDSSV